ncbi:putative metal homeostasis protein [Oenococcus oeni]|uniref:putative metal homeostasis protein n=1 Tax=Oenococcus oeni TaxID=1247 RepID=UPI0015D66BB6|nr:putative metal homeostasis protein [Oenococcus oeni]
MHKDLEKNDLSSAYRRLKSPSIKTRNRAKKIIQEYKKICRIRFWNRRESENQ